MKIVAAAFRNGLNTTARAASKGCRIQRGLNFEFQNALGRRHRHGCRGVGGQIVRINSIDLEIILSHARAVDRHVLRVAAKRGVVGKGYRRAG